MSQNGIDPRHARARELHRRGHSYNRIATELGVARTTVYGWLNPTYAERQREMSLAAKRRRKTPCPECGAIVGYENAGEPCAECKHEAEFGERNRRIVAAWNRGEDGATIGARENLDPGLVNSLIQDWRERGTYDVDRHQRRKCESWDLIEARWAQGATLAGIAAELNTTPGNVAEMVRNMRRAGRDVPYRRKVAA